MLQATEVVYSAEQRAHKTTAGTSEGTRTGTSEVADYRLLQSPLFGVRPLFFQTTLGGFPSTKGWVGLVGPHFFVRCRYMSQELLDEVRRIHHLIEPSFSDGVGEWQGVHLNESIMQR